jgi:hypothetical protein
LFKDNCRTIGTHSSICRKARAIYGYELLSIADSFNVCVLDAPIVAVCYSGT